MNITIAVGLQMSKEEILKGGAINTFDYGHENSWDEE